MDDSTFVVWKINNIQIIMSCHLQNNPSKMSCYIWNSLKLFSKTLIFTNLTTFTDSCHLGPDHARSFKTIEGCIKGPSSGVQHPPN